MTTLADIDAELARLADTLAHLIATRPRAEVLDAFSDAARPLAERVPAEHDAYVQERINTLLTDAGLVPDDPASS